MWLAHTDWLEHRLTVTGAVDAVAAFRAAAAGAGVIPWQLDLARCEEDFLHLLLAPGPPGAPPRAAGLGRPGSPAPPGLSLAGCRILARQLREAVERRQAVALARVGVSRACPFDLHALLPVPAEILALGPDDPQALAWLWQHWGTTALRHVTTLDRPAGGEPSEAAEAPGAGHARENGDTAAAGTTAARHVPAIAGVPAAAGEARFRVGFWSADWSPWRAVASLRTAWPDLRFRLQPRYGGS